MACCCKPGRSNKSSVSCLGRCDLPKHRCLVKHDIKPGPIPRHMGWLYTARDAPEHQLRCGWRPGHISCSVLKKIEQHNCMKSNDCTPCSSVCCSRPSCTHPTCCGAPPKCLSVCPSRPSCCKPQDTSNQPIIRIVRHAGEYSICTKPSDVCNAPHGPYPLKYVLNTDGEENSDKPDDKNPKVKYSVEAKFNDYQFDYTTSETSFIIDFSPPDQKCYKPCPKKGPPCTSC